MTIPTATAISSASNAVAVACPMCSANPCDCHQKIWGIWLTKENRWARLMGHWPARWADAARLLSSELVADYRPQAEIRRYTVIAAVPEQAQKEPAKAPAPPTMTFTEAQLARALFDTIPAILHECTERAENAPGMTDKQDRSEPSHVRHRRVLDVMWEKMKPDQRKWAEGVARGIFARKP